MWITPDPLTEEREILGGRKISWAAAEREAWLEAVPATAHFQIEIVAADVSRLKLPLSQYP